MDEQAQARQVAKSQEQHFVRMLIDEFQFAPRVAQAVLAEAQACLVTEGREPGAGQIRLMLSQRQASHGQPLGKTASVEVTWTLNNGAADQAVLHSQGRVALRRLRILRLLDEALEQGAVASQEDLAVALNVGVRTIKRDCQALAAQGIELPTRGRLKGIGRGQTHKAQIIGRWLRGETYDQLILSTRHSLTSIQRYIQTFVRVVALHQQGWSNSQIARFVLSSEALVQEYLAVYAQHDTPAWRERLHEHLSRFQQAPSPVPGKKGAP
jgi:hypothetical protein